MSRFYEIIVVSLICIVSSVLIGANFGQDINWDLLNYHFYSGYALLSGRLGTDVAPAQMQTWLNPLASLPAYILISSLPPRLAAAVLSAFYSLSLILVFFISRKTITKDQNEQSHSNLLLSSIATICAFSSPMFLSELGTSFNDNIGSIAILFAISVLFSGAFSCRAYFCAGLFIGLALALKLTNAFFFIAWMISIVVVERRRSLQSIFFTSVGAVLVYLPLGGVWNFYLFKKYENPLFPFSNKLFKSDFYEHISISDDRFKPKSFIEALDYFIKWPMGKHPTSEVVFSDVRFTVLFAFLVLVVFSYIYRYFNSKHINFKIFKSKNQVFLIIFFFSAFSVWLGLFGIQRYAIALEQLAPLLLIILLSIILGDRRVLLWVSAALMLVINLVVVRADWGRVPFTDNWFEVQIPRELKSENTLFVMLTGEPFAYVIPFFPKSDVFVRSEGNLPIGPQVGLGQSILATVAAHQGEIRTLAPANYVQEQSAAGLRQFGLTLDPGDCAEILTKAGRLLSCRLAQDVR